MGIEEFIGAKVLLFTMKKQDPKKIGIKVAELFDEFLDAELGVKRSAEIENVFVPWFKVFMEAFNRRLLECRG